MREIVLDTETTGFDPQSGDRIVEIGAIELINHMPTENRFHKYLNPQRDMPESAFAIHGLSIEFLSDKPLFADVAGEFIDFVGDSKMVIHNASFDMKFLNAELKWVDRPQLPMQQAIDTLEIARKKFPGAQNSLDALCRRFNIDNSSRTLHGALLDSEILAEVYLELVGGRQPDFALSIVNSDKSMSGYSSGGLSIGKRPNPLSPRISEAEKEAHREFVEKLGEKAVWKQFQ